MYICIYSTIPVLVRISREAQQLDDDKESNNNNKNNNNKQQEMRREMCKTNLWQSQMKWSKSFSKKQ